MAKIKWIPKTDATIVIIIRGIRLSVLINHEPKATSNPKANKFIACLPGRVRAELDTTPWSLPQAISDPVKVIAPINIPKKISTILIVCSAPAVLINGSRCPAKPTKTAAKPTKLCNKAPN